MASGSLNEDPGLFGPHSILWRVNRESAVTLAGLKKLVQQGFVKRNESVVLILTGHVLKDAEFTLKFHRGDLFAGTPQQAESQILKSQERAPIVLEPSVDAVVSLLKSAEN